MSKESSAWKKKWNPGLRVARCCSNCAHSRCEYVHSCAISPTSDRRRHRRDSSETCDYWKAAEWAKEVYGGRLK